MKQVTPLALVPASHFLYHQLATLVNQAYADYFLPVHLDAVDFARMCLYEDVDLARSVVALAGGVPVGSALFSRREARGWISGVGVLPTFRRQGIARQMVTHLQSEAQMLGLRAVTLEVLAQNEQGQILYRQLGFRDVRELLVLTLEAGIFEPRALSPSIASAAPERLLALYNRFHDVPPSWQREPEGLRRRVNELQGLAFEREGRLYGYLLYEVQRHHLSIFDVAARPGHPQRQRVAGALLLALHRLHPTLGGYVVNLPSASELLSVFRDIGYRIWQRQQEMSWQIPSSP